MQVNTLKMFGETVKVRKGGLTWVGPTGQQFMIGKTREEARETLWAWKSRDIDTLPSAPLPPGRTRSKSKVAMHYKRALYGARSRAKQNGRNVMSMEAFEVIVKRAGGRCELTGIPFSMSRSEGHRKSMWAPSLDRIKNSDGYEAENCRLVCVAVNLALNEFGADVLIKIASALMDRPDVAAQLAGKRKPDQEIFSPAPDTQP